jgi:hypothetical protein
LKKNEKTLIFKTSEIDLKKSLSSIIKIQQQQKQQPQQQQQQH